jgi:hypothetical protein
MNRYTLIALLTAAAFAVAPAIANQGDRLHRTDMDTIIFGKPVFSIDGKLPFRFEPPIVARDDKNEPIVIAPVPYLPMSRLHGPFDPIERIDVGHK